MFGFNKKNKTEVVNNKNHLIKLKKSLSWADGSLQKAFPLLMGGSSKTINSTNSVDVMALRREARTFEKENPIICQYLNCYVNGVIGSQGFNLSVKTFKKAGNVFEKDTTEEFILDENNNRLVEKNFWDFGKKGSFETSGRLSIDEVSKLAVRELKRDGEFFAIQHFGGKELNKYGYQLQLVNLDRFDTFLNIKLNNGNVVMQNVEFDPRGKIIAYYISKNIDNFNLKLEDKKKVSINDYMRIEKENAIHLFVSIESEQIRGRSPLSSVFATLRQVEGMIEADLIHATTTAGRVGYIETTEEGVTAETIASSMYKTSEFKLDENGNQVQVDSDNYNYEIDNTPGTIQILPPNSKFVESSPNYQSGFETYVKEINKRVSSGLNLSYERLSNDRANSSYSSSRHGSLDDYDNFKVLQNFIVENFLNVIFENFLKQSLLNKSFKLENNQVMSIDKYEEFKSNYQFRGRGFIQIDPKKDGDAAANAVKNMFTSRQRVCEQNGVDYFDIVKELAQEKKAAEDLGLTLEEVDKSLNAEIVKLKEQIEDQESEDK